MIVLYQVCTVVDVPPQLQSALAMLIAAIMAQAAWMRTTNTVAQLEELPALVLKKLKVHHSGHFPGSVRNLGSGRECDGTVSRAHACDFLQMYEELNKVTRQIVHESNWRNVGLTILTRASAQERLRFLASSRVFGLDEMEAIQ